MEIKGDWHRQGSPVAMKGAANCSSPRQPGYTWAAARQMGQWTTADWTGPRQRRQWCSQGMCTV